MLNDVPSKKRAPTVQGRVVLLVGCVLAGCLVGAIGQDVFGSSAWFLAVPGFVVVAWLFVANPNKCLPQQKISSRNNSTVP
jgi:hypothetical protein